MALDLEAFTAELHRYLERAFAPVNERARKAEERIVALEQRLAELEQRVPPAQIDARNFGEALRGHLNSNG